MHCSTSTMVFVHHYTSRIIHHFISELDNSALKFHVMITKFKPIAPNYFLQTPPWLLSSSLPDTASVQVTELTVAAGGKGLSRNRWVAHLNTSAFHLNCSVLGQDTLLALPAAGDGQRPPCMASPLSVHPRTACGYNVIYHHQCVDGWLIIVWSTLASLNSMKHYRSSDHYPSTTTSSCQCHWVCPSLCSCYRSCLGLYHCPRACPGF